MLDFLKARAGREGGVARQDPTASPLEWGFVTSKQSAAGWGFAAAEPSSWAHAVCCVGQAEETVPRPRVLDLLDARAVEM